MLALIMSLDEHLEQISSLDNDSLLRSLKRHVGSSNRLNALVLAHLAEVDARGAYRDWACDTLAAYCVYELRLSEDEAQRRCRAARVARQYPVLFAMLADASIHLTGILLLAPYLTVENHREVLARARYRRKREIERLVAELAPTQDVPALVEPLAPAIPRRFAPSTWASLVAGNEGWVRHLNGGDGPAQAPSASDDWHDTLTAMLDDAQSDAPARTEPAGDRDAPRTRTCADDDAPAGESPRDNADAPARKETSGDGDAPARKGSRDNADASARNASKDSPATPSSPAGARAPALRYRVQFTADQAYVDLLERARDLLWHQLPDADLAQLQRLALETLVEKLSSRKCGSARPKATPGPRRVSSDDASVPAEPCKAEGAAPARMEPRGSESEAPARKEPREGEGAAPARMEPREAESSAPARTEASAADAAPARTVHSATDSDAPARPAKTAANVNATPARHSSRHIPAAVRRQVWQRDGGRCTFSDARGVRCRATRAIEFHHEHPYALGGTHCAENVTLRCRSHNTLAAEGDFGRERMLAMKDYGQL